MKKNATLYSTESTTIVVDRFQLLQTPEAAPVILVSGLPRSGTSMMMKILEAGGLPLLTDAQRKADADNPEGYYEFERVKKLRGGDRDWLFEARGKAVKVISSLLPEIPAGLSCKILFMRRALPEVLASQRQMLIRRGELTRPDEDAAILPVFEKHLAHVQEWIRAQPHLQVFYVDYVDVVTTPEKVCEEINAFLGGGLDTKGMAAAVNPQLYRQRSL